MEPQAPLKLLLRLWHHINPRRRWQFTLLLVLMIGASFAEVLTLGMTVPFLGALTSPERVFEHRFTQLLIQPLGLTEPQQILLPLSIAFGVAATIAGAMRMLLLWAQTRLSHAIGAELSYDIYQRTLYQPYKTHLQRNSSEVIAGITSKTDTVVYQSLLPALTIISSSLLLLSILSSLLWISPVVAIAALATFGSVYAAIILLARRHLAIYSQTIALEANFVLKALQEGFGGIRDVLIEGTQTTYCDIYRNASQRLRRAAANVQIVGGMPRFAIEALGMVLIAGFALSLTRGPDGISNTIPVLGALAIGAQRLLPVLQQAYLSWTSIKSSQISLHDALDLLDQPLPAYAHEPQPEPLPFKTEIQIKNLSFQYSPGTPLVLRDVELRIPKGSRIGFIGSTGSGKSTLIDIIMGLLTPTGGSIEIDGVEVTEKNCRSWQANIAHVPQVIYLADKTIAENIAFGVPPDQIDFHRVRRAAQMAQLSETIENWELQYDTLVGENGVRLSGGQRQRIGVARALYKQAPVIVFDEATSALDNETERAVMQTIDSLGDNKTIIIVAHRLTTLQNCQMIVELQPGKGIKRTITYQDILSEGLVNENQP